jgi:excisionase family DNA binding protein
MSFPIKKIIAYRDFIDYFFKLDILLKKEVYSPYCAGDFQSLVPHPDEQISHTIKKIDTPLFNKSGLGKFVVNVGEAGVFYLELRSGNALESLSVDPGEVVVDLYYGQDDRLVYSFYNPSVKPALSVTAIINSDVDKIYEQLKADPGDVFWRQSFVREAMLSDKGTRQQYGPELMTAGQLAKYLQVSVKTIRNWTSAKKIPREKIGHTVRYRKSTIDDLIKSGKIPKLKHK